MAALSASAVRITDRAKEARDSLATSQRKKFEWWVERLRGDVFAGDQIQKGRIPAVLGKRNAWPEPLGNAWRFELPLAYRGIYTIITSTEGRVIVILEILSHKEYDRLFGYH